MNNPKDNEGKLAMAASSMGDSTPPVSEDRNPQGPPLYGYQPPAYPMAMQSGFEAAYPLNKQDGQDRGALPVPPPVGFKTPCPQTSQEHPDPYPLRPPVQNPPVQNPPGYEDNNRNGSINVGEDGEFKLFDFTEQSIRRAFIRKVYGILMCQLLISLAFISLFLFCAPVKNWAHENTIMLWVAMTVYFAMAIAMICCGEVRRRAPVNFIFLGLFTFATSYMLGVITSCFDVDLVMISVGITAAVVLALTLFAFQTKYDFTVMGGGLLCALLILILFGCICAFIPNRTMDVLYSSAGALIFSLYIVYDTQLMLGGNHKYNITPEEYIFAALNLYLDVINLFLRVLYLVARR